MFISHTSIFDSSWLECWSCIKNLNRFKPIPELIKVYSEGVESSHYQPYRIKVGQSHMG